MKRFSFRLESVLRVREFELERARVALRILEDERANRLRQVRETEDQLVRGRELLASEVAEGVDGQRVAMRSEGLAVGRLRLEQAQLRLAELNQPLEEARRLVAHRHTRVRSLERLEEKAAEEHRQAGLAAEQAEIEELAIGRVALARLEARRIMEERIG